MGILLKGLFITSTSVGIPSLYFSQKQGKRHLIESVYPEGHARNRIVAISCCFLAFGELLICPRHLLCSPKQQQCLLWPLFLQLEMLLLVNNYNAIKSICNLKKAVSGDNNFVVWNLSYPWDFVCLFSSNNNKIPSVLVRVLIIIWLVDTTVLIKMSWA